MKDQNKNSGLLRMSIAGLSGLLMLGMFAGCGTTSAGDKDVTITIFNSKGEIQDQMEQMAEDYSDSHPGVNVEMYYSKDDAATHLSQRYASKEPYTISLVDTKDIYSFGLDHAVNLSDQQWVKKTDYAIGKDGKIWGFPLTVEARGMLYNAQAIEKATGHKFDPSKYQTLEEFSSLLKEMSDKGMKYPVGIQKEDWSLSGHYLAQVYEQRDDPKQYMTDLHDGTAQIGDDAQFNALMDTFDLLRKYNYAQGEKALSAEREVTEQMLAEGKIAFLFGGNWDWSVINKYDYSKDMGEMPVPQDTAGDYNTKLVGGATKYFFIDNSATKAQQDAAKDFLDWLVEDKAGQEFISEKCSLVSPFKNNKIRIADPLSASVKEYVAQGKLTPQYNYMPDDHFSQVGAHLQKYLAGQMNRSQLGAQIDDYWKSIDISGLK